MAKAISKVGYGSGWHKQSVRHSNARRTGRAGGKYAEGKKYHIDVDFEGRRLADNVEIYETPKKKDRKVLVYSPELRANILIPKKELKPRDSDGDGVPDEKDCQPLNPKRQGKEHMTSLYFSNVTTYADPKTRKTIFTHKKHLGKGWYAVTIGDKLFKTRNPDIKIRDELSTNYSNYKKVSFFWQTSFHTKKGFGKYGMNDYNLDFTQRKKTGKKFYLEQPLKDERKKTFGKVKKTVDEEITDYVALDWKPEGDTVKLFITHAQHTPFKEDKNIYTSKEYSLSEKEKAKKDFKSYVEKIKNV